VHVLILGASARAAAYSARRAGLRPIAADLFADRDLRTIGPAERIAADSYPDGLADAADAAAPETPWIYTGALENHPELVERIARRRPLWGNDGSTLRAVRDPIAVAAILHHAGLRCPAVRTVAKGLPRDGTWLVKPLASAGGRGIAPLLEIGMDDDGSAAVPCYFQERIAGTSLAALFVAARGDATLAGVTRQWVGRRGSPFAYAGSLGPWPITPRVRGRIEAMGRALAAGFGLVGLFGVDLVLLDGEPWAVEVNPRYTASVEVLELALGRSLLAEHVRACAPDAPASADPAAHRPGARPPVVAKMIVFSPTACRFPRIADPADPPSDPFAVPRLGDVPDRGTPFEAGEPVLTLFSHGRSVAACRRRLERRRGLWMQRLRKSLS
jgi:predicted ATP-grasp superfamily ATP-dependent carboligase